MSKTRKILVPIVLILGVIQFIPQKHPESVADESAKIVVSDTEVKNILDKACMDCHSNETKYPWYAEITPLNYWIDGHVEHGRHHLNFSEWNSMPEADRRHAIKESIEVVEEKEMPMLFYWLIHWDAKLTDTERDKLIAYFEGLS